MGNFSQTLLIGMMGISLLALVVSFFVPLNRFTEMGFLIVAIIGLAVGRKEWYYLFAFKKYLFDNYFYLSVLVALFFISFAPYILDHFGYYVPTLKVLNAVGIQKGVANIELVLGQQSLWHFLQASIDDGVDVYLRLNGFLLIWFLMYVWETKAWYALLFFSFFVLFVQSPSPDLAIYFLSIYVINEWFFQLKKNESLLLLLSIWALLIKSTVFWLPLFIGVSIIFEVLANKKSLPWKSLLIGAVWVLISIFKSYEVSSNLIFPLQEFYVETHWKPNEKIIQQSGEFALQKGYNFQYSYDTLKHFNVLERLINWVELDGFKGVTNILIIGISFFFIFWVFRFRQKKYYLITIFLLLKLVLIFWISAQHRFMWDAIIIMILLYSQSIKKPKIILNFCTIGLFLVSIGFIFPKFIEKTIPSFQLSKMMNGFEVMQLWKPKEYEVAYKSGLTVGNVAFNTPLNYPFLFDTPFPALSKEDLSYYQNLGIFPQYEQNILIMKPLDEKKSQQLQKIIQQLE